MDIPTWLDDTVADMVAFLPRLVGAVVILLIGWVSGRVVPGGSSRDTGSREPDGGRHED